jgi:hypothetical protein
MTTASVRWQIWAAPLLLGAATAVGLVAALFSDAAGDWLAWLMLAAPVAVLGWHAVRPQDL